MCSGVCGVFTKYVMCVVMMCVCTYVCVVLGMWGYVCTTHRATRGTFLSWVDNEGE